MTLNKARGDGENAYLTEVEAQNERLARELEGRAGLAVGATGIDYRITGFWRLRTVIVPPHVYAVHTRRGHERPLHAGLGISFRFDPALDSFLLVPATLQTLLIDARCICRERQGVSVQAYVQWIVDDIDLAYRRLDFADRGDPMRLVNLQLREQAKAAIQDKVATMALDEVLSDRAPIIAELTERLRAVAEGRKEDGPDSGLGLRIVTVQIREAVVQSAKLWENLQKPFRAEKDRVARLAEITVEEELAARALVAKTKAEQETLAARERLAVLGAEIERKAIREAEETERTRKESELKLRLEESEREKRRVEAELVAVKARVPLETAHALRERARTEAALDLSEIKSRAASVTGERELLLLKTRRSVENDVTPERVREILVGKLPEIAAAIQAPEHAKTVSIGMGTAAAGIAPLAGLMALVPEIIGAVGCGGEKEKQS